MFGKVKILLAVANALTCVLSQEVAVDRPDLEARDRQTAAAPRKWILELISEAEKTFDVGLNVSANCKRDFGVYKLHRDNQTVWAVRMMESSEWPRTGVFAGVTTFLGNWAECLRSRGPGDIRGQYCLPEATYDFAVDTTVNQLGPRWVDWPQENESAWNVIQSYRTVPMRVSRQKLTWAVCIPASCKADDLQKSLTHTLQPIFKTYNFHVSVNVNPITCQTDDDFHYPREFIYAGVFFILLSLLTAVASVYDLLSRNTDQESPQETRTSIKLLKCFSTLKTWKSLTKQTPSTNTGLYTIKFVCLIFIIVSHDALLSMGFPKLEEEQAEMKYRPITIAFGFHSIVDIFFMISGFLTFFMDFERSLKHGLAYYIPSIILRWLRLIPVMAVVIVFFMFILPYLGSGPLWSTRFLNERNYCYSNWWTNILAVNNLIHPEQMCLLSTWYIAVDMQLAILGGALLMVVTKTRKIGIAVTSLTFILSVTATFLKIYFNNYYGVPMLVIKELDVIRKIETFHGMYMQIYPRVGPYLVGCALALLVRKLKENRYTFSQVQAFTWICTLCVVGYVPQGYGVLFHMIGRPYYVIENALFGAFHRILFVIPVAGLICIHFTSKIFIVSNVLEFKIFLPLGRLSYCAYLVSFPIQLYRFASFRRTIVSVNELDLLWQVMSVVGYTLVFALFFYMIAEGPLRNLTDLLQIYLIKRIKRTSKSKFNPSSETVDSRFTPTYDGFVTNGSLSKSSTITG